MDFSTLLKSDYEPLVIPDLPYEIKLAGTQIPNFLKQETELRKFLESTTETERSYGVVANSFYELEPAYADHYRKFLGIKAWHIGPTFLCNKDTYASLDEHECLKWLNSKTPNSVVYVSFGNVELCPYANTFFPWATDVAAKFGIPRLIFHGTGFFPLCASLSVILYEPHLKVSSDSEVFTIPNFPVEIKLTGSQIPDFLKTNVETEFSKLYKASKACEERSYGVIVNSFYELEPVYADHYRKVFGRKAWHIGPVLLCNKAIEDKAEMRGMEGSLDEHECLNWLNTKTPNSVVYICFGSLTNFSDPQLLEIALGLEASGKEFIWVVRREKKEKEEWLPEGFEQRMEGVSSGVPMITWPVSAEQFYNEKLVLRY
ncbi:unnamed protein product [Prunus brigantina]